MVFNPLSFFSFGSGRVSKFFGYVTMVFVWLAVITLLEFIVELIVNLMLAAISPGTPRFDLVGPLQVVDYAITWFPDAWRIGSILFWSSLEELFFGLSLIFSIAFALLGWSPFSAVSAVFARAADSAELRHKGFER